MTRDFTMKTASNVNVSTPELGIDEAAQGKTPRVLLGKVRKVALEADASERRLFAIPATCNRDYGTAEVEFMQAMEEYKRSSGRMFPTWSEVLEILQSLGYKKAEIPTSDRGKTMRIG
jgi:hypothetical protein